VILSVSEENLVRETFAIKFKLQSIADVNLIFSTAIIDVSMATDFSL